MKPAGILHRDNVIYPTEHFFRGDIAGLVDILWFIKWELENRGNTAALAHDKSFAEQLLNIMAEHVGRQRAERHLAKIRKARRQARKERRSYVRYWQSFFSDRRDRRSYRTAYVLDETQPVICTEIGKEPIFYFDALKEVNDHDCDFPPPAA